jgi:hypothetical protein
MHALGDVHNAMLNALSCAMSSARISCFFTIAHHNQIMVQARHSRVGDIRIKPEVKPVMQGTRGCEMPSCMEPGTHRVAKSRERLGDHIWVCLAHARAHNESWDFFSGMSEREIEAFRIDAVTGHRPTWPLGKRSARVHTGKFRVDDHLKTFTDEETSTPRAPERKLTGLQRAALDTLHLGERASLHEIKARYKELVKRFHPDANGGDRGAEERLKQVIKAYGVLRAAGMT